MMIEKGTVLAGRYMVLERIGTGGMSYVYKAMDQKLNRYIAVKVLKEEFANDAGFLAKFKTEAQAAACLTHPNIVNIYDVGADKGINYIIMEYIEGITLKTYIEKKGRILFKEAVSIAIQVAKGIEDAHNHNIIHRDIKPQNIMISTDGKVKVTDFGIARAANAETVTMAVMGSVHYISPEQARNGYVDYRSDIYSLGIVMYEMVTGRVPFDADSPVAVAVKHLQDEMVPASAYAHDLPISMQGIINKCTQKNPDRRYQNMGELLTDLKKALINPNENFVVIPGVGDQKTMMVNDREVEEFRSRSPRQDYEEEEEEEDYDYDDDEDDDEGGFLNPRMEKAVTIMGIVTAIVIVGIVIFLVGNVVGLFHFGSSSGNATSTTASSQQVSVPDVTGMTYSEAKTALSEKGLSIHASYEASDTVDEDKIISQDPKKGEKVSDNTTINVVISTGTANSKVPDVVGQTEEDAIAKLDAAGISYTITNEYSDDYDAGVVISQSPTGGSSISKNKKVTLTVSRGQETTTVPSLSGMSQSDAITALSNAGLNAGSITSDYSSSVEEGYVISQGTSAGRTVQMGSTVDMVISLGKKVDYVTVPSLVGKTYSEAASILSNYGLSIVEGSTAPSNSYTAGSVTSQYPSSGSSVESGTSITVNLSSGPYDDGNNDVGEGIGEGEGEGEGE